jgi:DNA-binding transcriptional ArsR family regulator
MIYYQDRMSLRNPLVHDATAVTPDLPLEIRAGTPFELLIALYGAGGDAGELWLHLLGVALDSGAADAEELVAVVERLRPLELRRHVVGVYVPSWRRLVGAETLERAARGDAAAAKRLLAHPRYYAGRARAALGDVLPLSARATKERVVAELDRFAAVELLPREAELRARLEADAAAKGALAAQADPLDVIDTACNGYRYEPEPDAEQVVLVPHLGAGRAILLCQHRETRLICYPAAAADGDDDRERLLALGRALGDPKRLCMLERLREGEASLDELAAEIGLARSTTHHHLAHLRAAGLVTFRGNASGYFYALDADGLAAGGGLVSRFVRP